MSRWAAFETLCAWLSPGAPSDNVAGDWDWETLVAVASEHLVTPALARPVAALSSAPEDAKQYFETFHEMNERRNATQLEAIEAIVDALGAAGIEPVLLKGAASFATSLYDDPAERFVCDIDILVRSDQTALAAERLGALGYHSDAAPRWFAPKHAHHLLPMANNDIGVEVHWVVVKHPFTAILPAEDIFAQADTFTWNGRKVRVPCATHRVVHNIAHDQLSHGHFRAGTVELRQLRELALLVDRYADVIDWREVTRRFEGSGQGHVLASQAAVLSALMRTRMPVAETAAPETMSRLRAAVSQSTTAAPTTRTAKLRGLIVHYATWFRDDPRLALNLLNPLWWPARIRGMWAHLAVDRPEPPSKPPARRDD